MKILFIDYEMLTNPLKNNLEQYIELKRSIIAIKHFRKLGNKFAIMTCNSPKLIHEKLITNKVEFDYLTSYNGKIITDNNQKLLYAEYINDDTLTTLLLLLKELGYNRNNIIIYGKDGEVRNNDKAVAIAIPKYSLTNKQLIKTILELFPNLKINNFNSSYYLTISNGGNKNIAVKWIVNEENKKNNVGEIYTLTRTNDIYNNNYNNYSDISIHKLIKNIK